VSGGGADSRESLDLESSWLPLFLIARDQFNWLCIQSKCIGSTILVN
jgi:hypothetical protein